MKIDTMSMFKKLFPYFYLNIDIIERNMSMLILVLIIALLKKVITKDIKLFIEKDLILNQSF